MTDLKQAVEKANKRIKLLQARDSFTDNLPLAKACIEETISFLIPLIDLAKRYLEAQKVMPQYCPSFDKEKHQPNEEQVFIQDAQLKHYKTTVSIVNEYDFRRGWEFACGYIIDLCTLVHVKEMAELQDKLAHEEALNSSYQVDLDKKQEELDRVVKAMEEERFMRNIAETGMKEALDKVAEKQEELDRLKKIEQRYLEASAVMPKIERLIYGDKHSMSFERHYAEQEELIDLCTLAHVKAMEEKDEEYSKLQAIKDADIHIMARQKAELDKAHLEIDRLKKIVSGITVEKIKDAIWTHAKNNKGEYDSDYALSCSEYNKLAQAIVNQLKEE